MRHEFICPEFARKSKCELTNCTYCKQMKQQNFMAIKSTTKPKLKPPAPCKKAAQENVNTKVDDIPKSSRYFKCESEKVLPVGLPRDDPDEDVSDEESSFGNNGPRHRPKLGTLPAFIPLGDSEEC